MRSLMLLVALGLPALVLCRPAEAAGAYPDEYALRPLQLPSGMLQLKVPVVINFSSGAIGRPIFIPLELRLGLQSDLELQIFHPRYGLCVTGASRGCGRVYDDIGFKMLYRLMHSGGMDIAFLGALELVSFHNPARLRFDAGVGWKLVRGQFSIAASPYLGIGLNHRQDNGDSFNLPAGFAFQISPLAALFLESGLYMDIHNMSDSWSMPLGVGVSYLLAHDVDIGAEFKFPDLIGYVALRN